MAAKKGFEEFADVFGHVTSEWSAVPAVLHPFLFLAHSPGPSCLEVIATDFHSLTFARVFSVHDLEDLRDDIGVGGSWSEFVDYLKSSLSSGDVKLILRGSHDVNSGNDQANLIALKSKGLPRISLSLNKILDMKANDVMAKLSLSLFKAFKKEHCEFLEEQERSSQLAESLSSEREKNDNLQKQLDSLSFLSKRKTPIPKSSDVLINSESADSGLQQQTGIAATKGPQSVKTIHRGAFVSRRPRARGVSLKNTLDDGDN